MLVVQLCPTLCNPMDCSPPGSSVYGILQARILEWVAIFSSRGSSWPRDQTQVSCIAGKFLTIWVTREAEYKDVLTVSVLRVSYGEPGEKTFCFSTSFLPLYQNKTLTFESSPRENSRRKTVSPCSPWSHSSIHITVNFLSEAHSFLYI